MELDASTYAFDSFAAYQEISCAHCTVSSDSMGSHFVNYGRRDCPAGDTLVLQGRVIGNWYTHTGTATNNMCVESTPSNLATNTAGSSSSARV